VKAKAATSTQVGLERWRELIRPLSWKGNHGSSSTRRDARLRNDSSVTAIPFVSHFVQLLRERRTGSDVWQSTPINFHPHEGAFYPAWLLRDFTNRALNGTSFAAAFAAQQAGSSCPCCRMYGVSHFWTAYGSCAFEELLLPTFVWQHHPRLIARAAPPLVLRVWANLNNMKANDDNLFAQLGCHLQAAPGGLGHFFGVKVPHFFFGRESAYFRAPLAGRCSAVTPAART